MNAQVELDYILNFKKKLIIEFVTCYLSFGISYMDFII